VKAGMLEIADVIVVNKADQPGAEEVLRDLRQQVRTGTTAEWRILVIAASASLGEGVDRVIDELTAHRDHAMRNGSLREKRKARLREHARMLAIREFSRFVSDEFEALAETSGPNELATAMISAFAMHHAPRKSS
jgi:LAO/AO transport system kinase